jgi:NAD-dependent SIR2 family protein deacetylase
MYSQTPISKFTNEYSNKLDSAKKLIQSAEAIVVGAGSGLSAAGGLNYIDESLALKWYPEYYGKGYHTILDIQGKYWSIDNSKPQLYWGFWAQHIWHIRYEAAVTQPYLDLAQILENTNYFLITTNVDSQIEKAGLASSKIFAPQGNYCFFQCSVPCSNELFYNEEMIKNMIQNMPSPFEIQKEDIPVCPYCGALLMPNLRCDGRFVEKPHMKLLPEYEQFVREGANKKIIFLELGVGYNTPGIIRFPFESLTQQYQNAWLIRINNTYASVPRKIKDKAISLHSDLSDIMSDLKFK